MDAIGQQNPSKAPELQSGEQRTSPLQDENADAGRSSLPKVIRGVLAAGSAILLIFGVYSLQQFREWLPPSSPVFSFFQSADKLFAVAMLCAPMIMAIAGQKNRSPNDFFLDAISSASSLSFFLIVAVFVGCGSLALFMFEAAHDVVVVKAPKDGTVRLNQNGFTSYLASVKAKSDERLLTPSGEWCLVFIESDSNKAVDAQCRRDAKKDEGNDFFTIQFYKNIEPNPLPSIND